MKNIYSLLFLFSFSIYAQTKGIVVDESNQPISYVSIWAENENNGTTSEENGEFTINTKDETKNLIFSALGYEKKIVKISESKEVQLKAIASEIDEVVIQKKYETKEIEIGKTKNETYQAFDNGPRIDVKYFPYLLAYKKTKFINQVSIYTDSKIENAMFKIHFYAVDSNGYPGDEILEKDYFVMVKKGTLKTRFNISEFNLTMPKKGLFVGFEKLIIEKNKVEKTVSDLNTNSITIQKTYYPFVLYNYVERDFLFTFSGGKWDRKTNEDTTKLSGKMKIYEPSIHLILTN